ncbi:hypothetical protein GRI99_09595 [Altererythrobacter buctensis]|uniref:Uncharacterized protein n=1 Tax=Alteraurantiacibacter buctensis TaxID=1503981 RepID=A0A844Z0I1_9SPHN|nr:hypothetical protein [Alteraurantiacibacter buctensis]
MRAAQVQHLIAAQPHAVGTIVERMADEPQVGGEREPLDRLPLRRDRRRMARTAGEGIAARGRAGGAIRSLGQCIDSGKLQPFGQPQTGFSLQPESTGAGAVVVSSVGAPGADARTDHEAALEHDLVARVPAESRQRQPRAMAAHHAIKGQSRIIAARPFRAQFGVAIVGQELEQAGRHVPFAIAGGQSQIAPEVIGGIRSQAPLATELAVLVAPEANGEVQRAFVVIELCEQRADAGGARRVEQGGEAQPLVVRAKLHLPAIGDPAPLSAQLDPLSGASGGIAGIAAESGIVVLPFCLGCGIARP